MQIFRQMAAKQVEEGDHQSTLVLTGDGNTFLYQAYLGQVSLETSDNLTVFVDDYAIRTGSVSDPVGSIARTWYDGISYAQIEKTDPSSTAGIEILPDGLNLGQNYPNPFNPVTTIPYTLSRSAEVSLLIYDLQGKLVRTVVDAYQGGGNYQATWSGRNDRGNPVASGIYIYRLNVDKLILQKKMILMR